MTPAQMAELHGLAFERGWTVSAFEAFLGDPAMEAVGVPEGFALARVVLDEAELLTIVIAPAFQGQGVGRKLLARLSDTLRARGVRRLFLEVAEDNPAARAMYTRAGFNETGRRRGYYARPGAAVDALLLTRTL